MPTYGTSVIPGTSITTQSGGTVSISRAFVAAVGLVGGYDKSNGTATGGEVYQVDSLSTAGDLFGVGSELYKQVRLAYANGAAEVHAVPVAETSVTGEDPSEGTAGELDNAPIFDPNVNSEHEITDQNGNDVNVSYDVGSETVTDTEAYVDPVDGEFTGDGSTSYALDYDHGDYASAITSSGLLDEEIRFVFVGTENTSIATTLLSELNDKATDFEFMRGIVGAKPDVSATDYSGSFDDQRLIVTAPSRGSDGDSEVRTGGAVSGLLTGNDLGDSATYESLNGIESTKTALTPSDAGDFLDKSVLSLIQFDTVTVSKGITTSSDDKFSRIHKCEIADEVTEVAHQAGQQFVGEPNITDNQEDLRDTVVSQLASMSDDSPPLLANPEGTQPYSVIVSTGASDTEIDLEIGIDIVDVMESIDVTINVGDVILNQGQV